MNSRVFVRPRTLSLSGQRSSFPSLMLATRFLVYVPYTRAAVDTLSKDDISLHPFPLLSGESAPRSSSRSWRRSWPFDVVTGCRRKRGGGVRKGEVASRALSCGGDIALLEPALISRHLQFSPPAIHPYFASRHASPNERLCSLRPAPSLAPPYPGVTGW